MRILMVVPYFYPAFYYGGPVRVTYELSRRLIKRGHEITVFTTDVLDNQKRQQKRTDNIEGVRVHYFRNIGNNIACRYHAFLPIGFYSALRRSSAEYELIHIHEYYTLLAVAAAKVARKSGIPFLLSAHGSLPVTPERGNEGRKTLFNRMFGNTTFRGISRVIALNEEERKQFLEFGIEEAKIEVIPNGVDIDEFKNLPDSKKFRERYGLGKKDQVVLYMGRIHQIKGLDILLKAFQKISSGVKEVKLVIVGADDGYLGTIKEMASDLGISSKVIFTGLLSDKEKLSAYAAADLFVLPSRSEGFPVTALEACASGLPIVITDKCHFPEVQRNGAGFEVPCDESSLHKAIEKLLNNPALREHMGKQGREMIFNNYDWNNIVLRLEEVYKNVVKTM